MGRPEKTANLKGQSGGKSKGCVSEATISKLLNDFHCTRFLAMGRKVTGEDSVNSQENELYSTRYAEILTSLKHLHLKKPADRRSKRKEKREIQHRTKSVVENKYNLSVAATSQKSVLWPGKLSSVANRLESNNAILQPSKLSTSVKWEKPLCSPSLTSSLLVSSSDEKNRIANTLLNPNISLFNNNKHKNIKTLPSSFSKLCKNLKSADKKNNGSTLHLFNGSHDPPFPHSNQTHHLAYRNCSAQCTQTGCIASVSCNHNDCDNNTITSSCNTCNIQSVPISLSSSQEGKLSNQVDTLTLAEAICMSDSCHEKKHSTITASSSSTSMSNGIVPERSCSEEMRMEEANVNELASYFEDLLHIPRKMSVMAEMMYA